MILLLSAPDFGKWTPRNGGITQDRHRQLAAFFDTRYAQVGPSLEVMAWAFFGVAFGPETKADRAAASKVPIPDADLRPDHQWHTGYNLDGVDGRCAIYGPQHADIEIDASLFDDQPASKWVADLWLPRVRLCRRWTWYIGLPPVGLSVTSDTEAKKYLGPCVKHNAGVALDIRTEVQGECAVTDFLCEIGRPPIGEPHGYHRNPWSRSEKMSGVISGRQRLAEMIEARNHGETGQFAWHPGRNLAFWQGGGGLDAEARLAGAQAMEREFVECVLETGDFTPEQVKRAFAASAATDPDLTGDTQ